MKISYVLKNSSPSTENHDLGSHWMELQEPDRDFRWISKFWKIYWWCYFWFKRNWRRELVIGRWKLDFPTGQCPAHKSKETKATIKELGIDFLDWPPYISDLNFIEVIWAILEDPIEKKILNLYMNWNKL